MGTKIVTKKIVLAGNPNVGKSVFFNKFTGSYVEVSNYPGSTVDLTRTQMGEFEVIDTPGIYGIGNYNEEEIVAKNIIIKADRIINVVNALSLERDLFLTQQLIDLDIPMVVALNQLDEACARGIRIDLSKLEKILGVKVFPVVAIKNQGIESVKEYISSSVFDKNRNDEKITEMLAFEEDETNKERIYIKRRKKVNKIFSKTVSQTDQGVNLSTKIGNLLLSPLYGSIAGILVLYALYMLIGVYISGNVVDFVDSKLFEGHYLPWIEKTISVHIKSWSIEPYLTGEFGILTMAVRYIFGVLLPLIMSFYFFMAILEDSGYLPRLAVLTDRFLSKMGLNGRAIIPIILGFGCTTMATITTRILGSKRERTIATAMLGLTIPCSAQLGIIIGLIAVIGGLKAWIIYLLTIFIVFILVGIILNRILPGKSSHLLIDLPPMRLPIIKNVAKKTFNKSVHFLKEASPLFVLGAIIITTLNLTNGLSFIQRIMEPLTVNVLNLPKEIATVFIMGIIRRDFATAGLAQMSGINGGTALLSHDQILTSLIVLTLFVPCIIAVTVLFKERGYKEATLIWLGSWVIAFGVGGIVARLIPVLL